VGQSQKLDLSLKGLFTAPNSLSGIPPGALEVADNIVINSKNLGESRRGQTQYGDPLTIGSGEVNKLFNYASTLIVNYDNKLAYDAGSGVWTNFSGTYNPPSSSYKMRSLEALRNFYFTTDSGIYKIDALGGTPRTAGVPKALGGEYATTGASGFLLENSAVAYRVVFGYRDANNNLILGAPSQRLIAVNPSGSGSSKDVSLTFPIPDGLTTSFFYQIYRSLGTATATDEPTDELQLVIQEQLTSGQISAKSFTVTDSVPYSLMRATLYTSPSQEGIANANLQPPFALDMDVFKNSAFYANTKQKQTLSIALISVDLPSLGYYVDATVNTTNLDTDLTGILSTAGLRVGMRAVGTGIPTNATIASILSGTSVRLSAACTATATVSVEFQDRFTVGGVNYWAGTTQSTSTNTFLCYVASTPGTNINETAINLVRLINTSTSNTTVYAYYISSLDDLPGQMLFEGRTLGGSVFYATSTVGASFSPVLPTSGTTIASDNEVKQNRVYISKQGQVEAVPIYSYLDIGSANFPIQRCVALRDGIFFFKSDGVYRVSGETFSSFTVTLIDNTVALKAPESAVAFNNQVFCFTTQGIVAVTDAGVQLMSVPIEDTLLELSSDQFTNFTSASFGVAYESARLYLFFTVTEEEDTFATQAYVYNALTDSWSRWIMDRTCGVVNTSVNKLFMAQPDTGQILIERKSYTSADYADEQYAVTIASVDSDTEMTLSSSTNVSEGMTIVQGNRTAVIDDLTGNVITVSGTDGFTAAAAIVYTPILNRVRWSGIDSDNPGVLKQFSEVMFFFKNTAFREIQAKFASNISTGVVTVPVLNNTGSAQWGNFDWGDQPWGGQFGGANVLRTYVPREKQMNNWLELSIETNEAFTGFSLEGISLWFTPMSSWVK
jgi:hypothetical protein